MDEDTAVYVGRDPFARGSFRRVSRGAGTCDWCGQRRRRVYSYTWHPDGTYLRYGENKEAFCNMDCMKAYYD